jgi:hypothetical protein
MATDPEERYPSAGDLGEAALVAAGELRRAGPESVVATGEAAPRRPGAEPTGAPRSDAAAEAPTAPQAAARGRAETLRWAIALATLVILFVCMVAALGAISRL